MQCLTTTIFSGALSKSIEWTRDPLTSLSPSLLSGAFILPTSSSLCAPPLPSSVLGQHQPPVAGFATPPHSTLPSQLPPQGAIPHPTSPSLCAPPLPLSSPGQRWRACCWNMQHPLMPHGASWLLGVTSASCHPCHCHEMCSNKSTCFVTCVVEIALLVWWWT